MKRGAFALASALALLGGLAAFPTAAAAYPDRPITLVIPVQAGGSHDLHARGITSIIADILGQPMIVRLMPGGAGMRGSAFVAQAAPDGYTLLFSHNGWDQLVPQTQKVAFDPLKDFKTVARINYGQLLFITRSDKPWKTLEDLIGHAKQNPGKVNWGHSGAWGAGHVPAAQLVRAAGIKVNFIPHRGGGPSLQAVLSGQDDVGIAFATQLRPHLKAGTIRVLAVAGDTRMEGDPDLKAVPTTAELGYPQSAFTMDRIFMAPSGVPEDRLKVLRDAFEKLTEHDSFKAFMKNIGEPVQFMRGGSMTSSAPRAGPSSPSSSKP